MRCVANETVYICILPRGNTQVLHDGDGERDKKACELYINAPRAGSVICVSVPA